MATCRTSIRSRSRAGSAHRQHDLAVAVAGVDQLELALLFDPPLDAPTDEAKEIINELSPRLTRFGIRPTVTRVGGVAMFQRYGALVYERH